MDVLSYLRLLIKGFFNLSFPPYHFCLFQMFPCALLFVALPLPSYYNIIRVWVFYLHICLCTTRVPVSVESRKGHQIPHSYRQLGAAARDQPCVLRRAASADQWAISPALVLSLHCVLEFHSLSAVCSSFTVTVGVKPTVAAEWMGWPWRWMYFAGTRVF